MTDAVTTRWKRNTVIFLTGQTVSLFGSMVVQYAVMWYVTLDTRSGFAVALYAIADFLPQGVVSLIGGTLADRLNRRMLVIVSDSLTALTTLGLALLMANGIRDLWIILLAVAIRSVGAGVQTPTVQAMIPQIVPSDQLMRVNGLFQSIQSGLALLAPAFAGVVYGFFGIVPVFFVDVVTAAIGVGLLALVSVPTLTAVAEKTTTFRADLVEGWRYIAAHPFLRWLMAVFAIVMVFAGAPSFITPLMVARTWGPEVWMVTVLEIAFSVGMVLGGVLVSTVFAKRSRIALILASSFGFAVVTSLLGLSPWLWLFYAFMFAFGLFIPLFSAPYMTLLQESVPPERQGRVFSYVSLVMAVSTPLAMAVFGPLADVVSVQALLIVAGAVLVVVLGVAILAPSGGRAIRAASADASPRAAALVEEGGTRP
ncbi:MAG: MFS transporter [Micrococcales bacterium]|nr:MFS transporter [Micrococcales bacterium]